jgi:CBS domain-containing protein
VTHGLEPLEFLRLQPPFDSLREEELARIEPVLETVYWPRGSDVAGVRGDGCLYVIRKGAVEVSTGQPSARTLEEGEILGPGLGPGEDASRSEVLVVEGTLAHVLPAQVVESLFAVPAFAAFFAEGLDERLRRVRGLGLSPLSSNMEKSLGALVARAPVCVSPLTTVAEAAATMRDRHVSSVIVDAGDPGILTGRDLRDRVLASGLASATPVQAVASRPLVTLPAAAPLQDGLLLMLERRIQHLPVTEGHHVVGMVTAADLLRHTGASPQHLLERVARVDRPEELLGCATEVAVMAERLHRGGLDPLHIGRIVAILGDEVVRALSRLAESQLGRPPCAYAWLALGSGARMEQLLLTGDEYAIVYLEDRPQATTYFRELAELVEGGLRRAGITAWGAGTALASDLLSRVVRRLEGWVASPQLSDTEDKRTYLDFRPVRGELSLDPLYDVMAGAHAQPRFLERLAATTQAPDPPARRGGEPRAFDVERVGIAPVADLGRLCALAVGSLEVSTRQRFEAGAQAGWISRTAADTLVEGLRFLLSLKLCRQLESIGAGLQPSHDITLEGLSPLERSSLKDVFVVVHEVRDAIVQRSRATDR